MAASIKLSPPLFRIHGKIVSKVRTTPVHIRAWRTFSSIVNSNESIDVRYPPIKPKYPPGLWGEITPKKAWELQELRDILVTKPTAKWRLEHISGVEPGKIMWIVRPVDAQPATLGYKQYITKTHLEHSQPDAYQENNMLIEAMAKRVRSQVEDVILMEKELCFKYRPRTMHLKRVESYYRHKVLKQIINTLLSNLCYKAPHLHMVQVDENVRVESFWQRIACGDEDDFRTYGRYNYGAGRLWFQGCHQASLQVRSELPLAEFVPLNHEVCHGNVPDMTYSPAVFGMKHLKRRSFNMSGHWQEDPCEFTLLSVHVQDYTLDTYLEKYGDQYYDEASTNYGMTAAFLSCAAQAHNQGFNWLMDLTYPFTTQSIMSDGRRFQFLAYQLNTLRLWVDDNCNTTRNVCWTSEIMPLYETIENGQIRGFNNEVLNQLIRYVLLAPIDREINLRPYLPDEVAPAKRKDKFINFKGEDVIPFTEKPGQYEYPKDSMYFQQNI